MRNNNNVTNNNHYSFTVENDLMICPFCKGIMQNYMDTFVCPSCQPDQIRDLTWCKQHMEQKE